MQASGSQENLPPGGYPALKRDILRGVFAPGEKLLMSALKARYGLGVGPLREALSQLVAEHLVALHEEAPEQPEWKQYGPVCLAYLNVSSVELEIWLDALHAQFDSVSMG